jgi:hypothetical protein
MSPINNSVPFHIIGAPLTLYLAAVETAFPAIDAAEGDFDPAWFKVGTSGDKDYDEAGVVVNLEEPINEFRGAGSTLPRKLFRTEEDVRIEATLADLSAEQYAKTINDNTVTTVAAGAGTAGEKGFSLVRGLFVATYALLARGPSPAMADGFSQYEIDSVAAIGAKQLTYTKGQPALLAAEFRTIDAAGSGEGVEHRIQTDHAAS